MKIGTNTYGLGKWLYQNWDKTLTGLKEAGITSIEPCVAFPKEGHPTPIPEKYLELMQKAGLQGGVFQKDKAPEVIRELRERGFEVCSIHVMGLPFTVEDLQEVLSFIKENEIRYAVNSFNSSSVDEMKTFSPVLREAAPLFRAEGKELLIHNHDAEWRPDGDTCVMEWLLQNVPEINFEIDLGWTEYAGVDSVSVLEKWPERFPLLHLKEIKKNAVVGRIPWEREAFCTVHGEGILPLQRIMDTAAKMPIDEYAYIIDQDDSVSGDIVSDIAKGIQNIEKYW